MKVAGLEENGIVIIRADCQQALATLYSILLLLSSAAAWAETMLGIKRSRSERKATIYGRTALKRTETVRLPLKIEAEVGAHNREEEDFVDEIEPATLSTPIKDKRTAISKRVRAMAQLPAIWDLDFRNLAVTTILTSEWI